MTPENSRISYGLWFNGNAAEAIDFYKTVFNNVEVTRQARYSEVAADKHGQQPGTLMFANFTLEDAVFQAINGGEEFSKNPSISFFVNCQTADEGRAYWEKLAVNGKVMMGLDKYDWSPMYGWIEDAYGLSWQIYTVQEGQTVNQKINPSLMFVNSRHGKAEEAINFYLSVFRNSKSEGVLKYPPGSGADEGTVMHAQFELNGQTFMAMDSAHAHKFDFNGGTSFVINCTSQDEVDYYWEKLLEGGNAWQCGWLQDKFGIAWQIVPVEMDRLMTSGDKEAVKRVTAEMMRQVKLDLHRLRKAFDGVLED